MKGKESIMPTVYILIMLWGGNTSNSGLMNITQEFYTLEKCEAARAILEKAHKQTYGMVLVSQGCHPK
jgi:hypothetical protein